MSPLSTPLQEIRPESLNQWSLNFQAIFLKETSRSGRHFLGVRLVRFAASSFSRCRSFGSSPALFSQWGGVEPWRVTNKKNDFNSKSSRMIVYMILIVTEMSTGNVHWHDKVWTKVRNSTLATNIWSKLRLTVFNLYGVVFETHRNLEPFLHFQTTNLIHQFTVEW